MTTGQPTDEVVRIGARAVRTDAEAARTDVETTRTDAKAGVGRLSKIVIAGPVGVGKTTATRVASDVPVLTTEARPTDGTRELKGSTTVAMDFGVMRLDAGHVVHLYGTPGQSRFDFMWDILATGGSGVIVLVDGRPDVPTSSLDVYLEAFASLVAQERVAIGVTRLAVGGRRGLDRWHRALRARGVTVPVFEADPRRARDIELLVRALTTLPPPVPRPASNARPDQEPG